MDIGYLGALLGGLLSLLSPCSVMLLPAFFAYAFTTPAALVGRTGLFYLGLITTLVPLGVLAGSVGAFFASNRDTVILVAAALVILLGVVQLLGIPLPQFGRRGASGDGGNALAVYLLGTVYGVAGVCTGPILGSVLTIAAAGGSPAYGAMLLAVYALGMTAPLLVLALVWKRVAAGGHRWLRPRVLRIGRWQNSWHAIASGVFSIALGVVLLLTARGGQGGGLLSAHTQYRIEQWIAGLGASVSNLTALLILAGAGGAIALFAWLLGRRRSGAAAAARVEDAAEPANEPAAVARD